MCKGITHTRHLEQQAKEYRWENFKQVADGTESEQETQIQMLL
jgi:hypothetical protein